MADEKNLLAPREFHARIESKSVSGDDHLIIEGWASTRDIDRSEERIEPEAFRSGAAAFMKNPILLNQHDYMQPIGKVLSMEIKELEGFWVKAMLSKAEDVKHIVTKIREGILRAMSIGFKPITYEMDTDVRIWKEIELYEVSVVSIPANREALFSVAKGLKYGSDIVVPYPEITKEIELLRSESAELKALLKQASAVPVTNDTQPVNGSSVEEADERYKRAFAELAAINRELREAETAALLRELKGTAHSVKEIIHNGR